MKHPAWACGLLLLLAACATPNAPSPEHGVPIPAAFAQLPAGDTEKLSAEWWLGFRSEELIRLVAAGIEANPDVAIAIRRIEQAEARRWIPMKHPYGARWHETRGAPMCCRGGVARGQRVGVISSH